MVRFCWSTSSFCCRSGRSASPPRPWAGNGAAQNLIWLLSRPLPKPAIFLGKYLAVLPWCLALNLGGLALICAVAGEVGMQAFLLYWPAVIGTTLTYAALFHVLGALVRRPAMLALLYAFFFEMIVGLMPGHLKRLSITFYTRCMMYERAQAFDSTVDLRNFEPVAAADAWLILLLASAGPFGRGHLGLLPPRIPGQRHLTCSGVTSPRTQEVRWGLSQSFVNFLEKICFRFLGALAYQHI